MQRAPWIAAAVVAVICVAALIAYLSGRSPKEGRANEKTAVAAGVACPGLMSAQGALEAGEDQEIAFSIRDAKKAALRALDSSAARFGRPERVALALGTRRLDTPISTDTRVWLRRKLTTAETACDEIESS